MANDPWWKLPTKDRIDLAKLKMARVVNHSLSLIEIHANNSFIVYSPTLSSQIPRSYAANAFNVFLRSMYQFEILRLCALWDRAREDRESIPTVIKLIDDDATIEALAVEAGLPWIDGSHLDKEFAQQSSLRAKTGLIETIAEVKQILESSLLSSVLNLRNSSIAHSLTPPQKQEHDHLPAMKVGDETNLMKRSIPIVERLYRWVNGTSFSIVDSQRIDQEYAEALWTNCKFSIP